MRHSWRLTAADYYEARYRCLKCGCIKTVKAMHVGEKRPMINYRTIAEKVTSNAPQCST